MNLQSYNKNSYNNADSFSMAFDAAWKEYDLKNNKNLNIEEKIEIIFEKIKKHPFLIENPIESRNIAFFRINLLGLS